MEKISAPDSNAIEWLQRIVTLLDDEEDVVASMPIEEVKAELRANGINPDKPLSNRFREIITNLNLTTVSKARPSVSAVFGLLSKAMSVSLVPIPALSAVNESRESIKEISLTSVFDESLLFERLPWAVPKICIAREADDQEASTALYIAYAYLKPNEPKRNGTLRMVLSDVNGLSSEVELSPNCLSGIFVGDPLSYDWDTFSLKLDLDPVC
jgi:hypothetical protein